MIDLHEVVRTPTPTRRRSLSSSGEEVLRPGSKAGRAAGVEHMHGELERGLAEREGLPGWAGRAPHNTHGVGTSPVTGEISAAGWQWSGLAKGGSKVRGGGGR